MFFTFKYLYISINCLLCGIIISTIDTKRIRFDPLHSLVLWLHVYLSPQEGAIDQNRFARELFNVFLAEIQSAVFTEQR